MDMGVTDGSRSDQYKTDWFLSNCRGLRQAVGELRAYLAAHKPAFFALDETHLMGDSTQHLLPSTYKMVARLDRTKHGGGLYIGAKSHLLVNQLDLASYNTVKEAEIVGVRYDDVDYLLCYTHKSSTAVKLLLAVQRYMLDNPGRKVVLLGDFNLHNQDWIKSATTDSAGVEAQEMCDTFGLNQLVDFATRGDNTLDLVMSSIPGVASPAPSMGSSDHKSVWVSFQAGTQPPSTPESSLVHDWSSAPWDHIRGYLRRVLLKWDPRCCESVTTAEESLRGFMQAAIDKYMKVKRMTPKLPAPWWNYTCDKKLRHKCRMFKLLEEGSVGTEAYRCAVRICRKVQKKAYAR